MTFDKILIANRGEIACRVIATARKMGMATVAVYSDADAGAKHVAMADEAIHIGAPPVSESYLRGDRIIQAALDTGAQAIHPGYGFLSENPDFVESVEDAGLTFIGPPVEAIRAMGLKDAAKALMEKANVPVVPGYHGDSQDPKTLAQEAESIGYPVLIKARAGGGGKGMRLVEQPKEFAAALEAAQREGQAAFGDPHCLIEKYITQPRHVEIQVFADSHSNVVHLFERDCSLQRRHQKVIEEAPAPGMPDDVRAAMGRAAVEAARAIGYQGAGTVEFIVDGSNGLRADGFWFMEMNTRLQVEHPVTEAITGNDLVELQLRVASGQPLPFSQEDLIIDGHAFEARIYAEDPTRDFVPAIGRMHHLEFPEGSGFERGPIRVDSGVRGGDNISPYYDPMIAKLIVHGPDRATALRSLRKALEQTDIAGVTTNIPFLAALCDHAEFAAGKMDTGLIARNLDTLTLGILCPPNIVAFASLAALGLLQPTTSNPWSSLQGFRLYGTAKHKVTLICDGDRITTEVEIDEGFTVNGVPIEVSHQIRNRWIVTYQGRRSRLSLIVTDNLIFVMERGRTHVFTLPDPLVGQSDTAATADVILSPMPGKVTQILTHPDSTVTQGDPVAIVEAMKMEHTLVAPRDGFVADVLVQAGDQVSDGMVLVQLDPKDE